MRKDMSLDSTQEGVVAASILGGMIIGNLGMGMLSDQVGRKNIIMTTTIGVGLFTAIAFFAKEWWHIAALRVGVGICVSGSMVPSNSLVSEVLPKDARGRWLTSLHIFW